MLAVVSHQLRWGLASLLALILSASASAQHGASSGEWRHHGGDHGFTRYTPLSQIDASNFGRLEPAWKWSSADSRVEQNSPYDRQVFRSSPLIIDGRLYIPTELSQVAALDAGTGEELWVYDPKSYERGKPAQNNYYTRGLEYWTDGEQERLFLATIGKQLVSLDPATGLPDRAFGEDGVVELSQNLGRENIALRNISHGQPVIVVGDTIVVGSRIYDFPLQNNNPPGHVRGYDVRTGEFKWRFHTIPQEGEDFVDTWENDSWKTVGNANVWAPMTADQELGYVYLATSTPTSDYYGGLRHGDNVYSESLICVDAATGERVWHFQTVHHGVWDYDIASAPNLIDIVVGGRLIKAVAQVSKTAFTYVFDRATGEQVWPIEERPVPWESSVPGEKLSKTQPFPTRPPAFDRQGVSEDDLIDFTPELRAEALEIAEKFILGPMFMPLIERGAGGKEAILAVPGAGGGANHPGAAADPETGMLFVQSMTRPSGMALVKPDGARSFWPYVLDRVSTAGPRGLPLLKPPYRRITGIDLNRGDIAWQKPFGDGPRNHPAIRHLDLGPLGGLSSSAVTEGGLLVTKTLLVTHVARFETYNDRSTVLGSSLQAYDKSTGKLLAEVLTERALHGAPVSYMVEGRQYIVVTGGGITEPAELIAFALPESEVP